MIVSDLSNSIHRQTHIFDIVSNVRKYTPPDNFVENSLMVVLNHQILHEGLGYSIIEENSVKRILLDKDYPTDFKLFISYDKKY